MIIADTSRTKRKFGDADPLGSCDAPIFSDTFRAMSKGLLTSISPCCEAQSALSISFAANGGQVVMTQGNDFWEEAGSMPE